MGRNRNVYLLSFLVICLSACNDDDIDIPYFDFVLYSPGSQDSGFGKAKVFDKEWQATASVFPFEFEPQYVSIRFETYSPEGFNRDELVFGNFTLKVGLYTVIDDPSADTSQDDNLIYGIYGQYQDDGDVIHGGYELDNDFPNTFYIERIDTIAHTVEGGFNALFKLRESYLHANLARQVLFEDGEFMVKY